MNRIILIIMLVIIQIACKNDKKLYPPELPDVSCLPDNPLAEIDLTIPEVCDHKDNNCNGIVDEGCECYFTGFVDCWDDENYPLEYHTKNGFGRLHGECKYGRQMCRKFETGGSQMGMWEHGADQIGGTDDDVWFPGGCSGIVLPSTEMCDGKDNNCDGRVDESLKKLCWSGPKNSDGTPADYIVFNDPTNFASCKTGIQTCESGRWTGCLHEVLPGEETCNGIDDDCDGVVDDDPRGAGLRCGMTDVGICEYGAYVCTHNNSINADLECVGTILPETEICNGIDDDCDGEIDEELIKSCQSICGSGVETCNAGSWVGCTAALPTDEVCDGFDNNCNGEIDEDIDCGCPPEMIGSLVPCQSNPLQCGLGYMECQCETVECFSTIFSDCQALCAFRPELQEECISTVGIPVMETCNNWDDDCDTEVDEFLFQECYTGPNGSLGVGSCAPGEQSCKNGRWGANIGDIFVDNACVGQTLPVDETCNHLDDDCDTEIDEDLDQHDKVDMVFVIDRSRSMCGTINALRTGIEPYILEFIGSEHRFAIVNVPGSEGIWKNGPPNLMTNFVDAATFRALLNDVDCDHNNIEPQYDAVFKVATNTLNLMFRQDAYPMMIVITDEIAQSLENITAETIRNAISPCQVGDCGNNNRFETYAIVPRVFNNEWCAPADIALGCYDLYPGITSEQVRLYLEDIFSEVCR